MPFRGSSKQGEQAPLPPFAPDEPPEPPVLHVVDGFGVADGAPGETPEPVIDLNATAASERYSAWADRMRDKRRRDQARIRGLAPEAEGADQGPNWHWNADTVMGQGTRDDLSDAWSMSTGADRAQAFAVLGLEPGVSVDDVTLAYKRLAKVHHPDRWAGADAEARRHHSEEMLRVNAAYRVLRADTLT